MISYSELKEMSKPIDAYTFCQNTKKQLGFCPDMKYSSSSHETTAHRSDQERIKEKIKEFINRMKDIAAIIIITVLAGR